MRLIWRINNYTYGASSLPLPFYPAYDNLLIPVVLLAMDKFVFQCFIPTDVRYGVVPSSIGILTVDARNSVQNWKNLVVMLTRNRYCLSIQSKLAVQEVLKLSITLILDVFFSSLLLAFFLGSCNRSLVVQVACWAYAKTR